ncbi:hypothetical protein TWF481_006619 [Arthrobotrys musiformis]|uniref:Uncharacterized protein n=1 Tax=Arthrobotrys musiformis TaxID=47236 RepID=A0AAV9WA16_9PEZI
MGEGGSFVEGLAAAASNGGGLGAASIDWWSMPADWVEDAGKGDDIVIAAVAGDGVPSKKRSAGGDAVLDVEDAVVVAMVVVEKTGVEVGMGQFEGARNGGRAAVEARSAAIAAEAGDAAAGQIATKVRRGRWRKEAVAAGPAGGNAEDGDGLAAGDLAGDLADALAADALVGGSVLSVETWSWSAKFNFRACSDFHRKMTNAARTTDQKSCQGRDNRGCKTDTQNRTRRFAASFAERWTAPWAGRLAQTRAMHKV